MTALKPEIIELWKESAATDGQQRNMIFPDEWRALCDLAIKGCGVRPEGGGSYHKELAAKCRFRASACPDAVAAACLREAATALEPHSDADK